MAYEKVGDAAKAREYYEKAAAVEVKPVDCAYNYEKALAMLKLDQKANVNPMFREMLSFGENSVTDYVERFFESFDYGPRPEDVNTKAYYIQGLAWKALGKESKARGCFGKALGQRNDNVWANYYLNNIK